MIRNEKQLFGEKRNMIVRTKKIVIIFFGIVLAGYPVGVMADSTQQSSSQISTTSSSQVKSSSAESSVASSQMQQDSNESSKIQPKISSSSSESVMSSSSKTDNSGKTNQNDGPKSVVVTKNGWVTDDN